VPNHLHQPHELVDADHDLVTAARRDEELRVAEGLQGSRKGPFRTQVTRHTERTQVTRHTERTQVTRHRAHASDAPHRAHASDAPHRAHASDAPHRAHTFRAAAVRMIASIAPAFRARSWTPTSREFMVRRRPQTKRMRHGTATKNTHTPTRHLVHILGVQRVTAEVVGYPVSDLPHARSQVVVNEALHRLPANAVTSHHVTPNRLN
jgi:hypothetical protein